MTKNYKQNKVTSNGMKKYLPYILMLIVLVGIFSPMTQVNAQTTYELLAPLPKIDKIFNPEETNALGKYLNLMIKIFIGLCAVLSVVMIVVGGLEYMTSELAHTKEAGKERIWQAVLGLLIALGAYALLNTINPDLLDTKLESLKKIVIKIEKDLIVVRNGKVSAGDGSSINPDSIGTSCDSRTIMSAAQSAGQTITEGQAATFACLITPESGCKSVTNYNWGGGSSAYGPYQILLQTHSDCFENPVCYAAAGVTGPLSCSTGFHNGNPIPDSVVVQQCKKAADNFTCSTGAAICVLKKQGFSAWTADPSNAKQQACVDKYNL